MENEGRLMDAFGIVNGKSGVFASDDYSLALLHIGPHKSGTTWLQKKFFPSIQNAVFRNDFGPTHRSIINPAFGDFSIASVHNEMRELLQESNSRRNPLILSDEALGGRPFGQKFYPQIFAYRLRAAFPTGSVLIVCREQRTILASMYSEYLRYGHSKNLRQFLVSQAPGPNAVGNTVMDFYFFDRMLDFYRAVFGEQRVLMVPFEWMVKDPQALLERVSKLLGVELYFRELPSSQPERPSWSSWAQYVQRFANQHLLRDGRSDRKLGVLKPNSLAYRVDMLTPAWARRRGVQKRRQVVEAAVGDRYIESNRRLEGMIGFDLGALGYSV